MRQIRSWTTLWGEDLERLVEEQEKEENGGWALVRYVPDPTDPRTWPGIAVFEGPELPDVALSKFAADLSSRLSKFAVEGDPGPRTADPTSGQALRGVFAGWPDLPMPEPGAAEVSPEMRERRARAQDMAAEVTRGIEELQGKTSGESLSDEDHDLEAQLAQAQAEMSAWRRTARARGQALDDAREKLAKEQEYRRLRDQERDQEREPGKLEREQERDRGKLGRDPSSRMGGADFGVDLGHAGA